MRNGERFFGFWLLLTAILFGPSVFAQHEKAPNFVLKSIDGKEVTLASFSGKIVILDFWAVYCPPCREEIPGFVDLYKNYKDKGLEIIGISVDREVSKVISFIETNKVTYPIVFHSKDVLDAYGGIQAIPTTFILNKNLEIVEKQVGFAEKSFFEGKIKSLLFSEQEIPQIIPATSPEKLATSTPE